MPSELQPRSVCGDTNLTRRMTLETLWISKGKHLREGIWSKATVKWISINKVSWDSSVPLPVYRGLINESQLNAISFHNNTSKDIDKAEALKIGKGKWLSNFLSRTDWPYLSALYVIHMQNASNQVNRLFNSWHFPSDVKCFKRSTK